MNYPGIIIEKIVIKDAASKKKAMNRLKGWKRKEQPIEAWMRELERGHPIVLADMKPNDDGTYTHAIANWVSTHFICCDADNIVGVDMKADGSDENPNGVEPWIEENGLSIRFPGLRVKVFAVAESVSSMHKDPPHRRYRLIFFFDKPITDPDQYHRILLALAKEFPIIPQIERSPAQPVFGNARPDTSKVYILKDNVLSLDEYLQKTEPPPARPEPQQNIFNKKAQARVAPLKTKTLEEWLREWSIAYEADTKREGKFFVQCPYKHHHTDGVCKPKDAYVFENDTGQFAYHCSHTSCKSSGRATWESFKNGHGIQSRREQYEVRTRNPVSQEPAPEPYTEPKEETELPRFPIEVLENTIFGDYEQAYHDRNETCAAFRFAELAFAFGALLGRKVHFKSNVRPVFPNFYIGLVGRSFYAKKSESLYKSERLIDEYLSDTLMITNRINSAEGLIAMMTEAEDTRLVISLDEFREFFVKARQKATEGLIPTLNRLFGCPEIEALNTKDRLEAVRPTVSIIGAITPNWFEESITLNSIGGGFINRFAFFLHEQMPLKSMSEVEGPNTDYLQLVKKSLKHHAENRDYRAFELDKEVQAYEKEWYHTRYGELMDKEDVLVDVTTRSQIHVQKIALLLSLTENGSYDDEIHIKEWKAACEIGDYLIAVNQHLFRHMGFSELTQQEINVLKKLDELGGQATKTQISDKVGRRKLSARELMKILEALYENEVISLTKDGRATVVTRLK